MNDENVGLDGGNQVFDFWYRVRFGAHARFGTVKISNFFGLFFPSTLSMLQKPQRVEAVASGRAMEHRAKNAGFASTQELADRARAGDEKARELFDQMGWAIGAISGRLANVVDLEVIVIGGGFGATFDLWEDGAKRGLKENIVVPHLRIIPEFIRAQLGNDAGVIGVADFAYGRV